MLKKNNEKNHSLIELIDIAERELKSSSDSARLDGQILLCFVLNKDRSYLLTWPDKKLDCIDNELFFTLLKRRKNGEPIAYITGIKEFWSLPLFVSPATLIPRPDTETLVELVLSLFIDKQNESVSCLDLGTGTGAIALALASENNHWDIDAIDFSFDAVTLAKKNADNLKLLQVNIYQSDWFSAIASDKQFDIIVANPPYIDGNDIHLVDGDVRFEPKSALVARENGFLDIKIIACDSRNYLKPKGKLFVEHGYEQAIQVHEILTNLGYRNVKTVQDLNGLDRITWATL